MINYTDAIEIIKHQMSDLLFSTADVGLIDSLNMISGADYLTNSDFPRFNNSAMDGIAIIYDSNQKKWQINDELAAGSFKDLNVDITSCISIMTGAMLPNGFDTIIPVEDIILDESFAELKPGIKIKKGQNIRIKGEDSKIGSVILTQKEIIKSKHIGLLASCSYDKIKIYKNLKVGVLTTGNELIDINEVPIGDKIIASNIYSLFSLVRESGLDFQSFGIIKDNKDEIKERIKTALDSDIDVLITSGGVSEGKYDYISDVLKELNSEIFFHKANIKPGKPILFAKNNEKLILGLPGNPVAVYVTYKVFFDRVIKEIYQSNSIKESRFFAIIKEDIKKKDGKRHFLRGILNFNSKTNEYQVEKSGKQSSADLLGLAKSNCLVIIPEEIKELKKGDKAECIMI
jgi:molybdopterin molybdotransferase